MPKKQKSRPNPDFDEEENLQENSPQEKKELTLYALLQVEKTASKDEIVLMHLKTPTSL